jgi:Protein of unknown function (DUF1153)
VDGVMMSSPALVRRVLAPDGTVLTLANLPPADTQRWVVSRKAIIVAAVRGGLLSMSDACARYRLTTEEFLGWQTQVDSNGLQGLRTTRIQEYRGSARRAQGPNIRGAGPRSKGTQRLQPRSGQAEWLGERAPTITARARERA